MGLVPLVKRETIAEAQESFLETHQPRTESWMQIATTKAKGQSKFSSKLALHQFGKSIQIQLMVEVHFYNIRIQHTQENFSNTTIINKN